MFWATRWFAVVAAVVLTSLVGAAPAAAHNSLRATSPIDGETVARTPAAVVLTFREPALDIGTQILITGPAGPVHQGPARLIDNTVSQDLQPGAPAGAYTVTWRVTSADGHTLSGVFTFTSAAAGDSSTTGASSSLPSTTPSADVGPSMSVRIGVGLLIGGIVLAAAVLTARALHRRPSR